MENTGGWKVIITVPQLNGANDQHIWVAAISDEAEVRTRLWLDQIPCEAHFERLSLEEFRGLQLERGEVRRILLPWTANPGVPAVNEMAGPEQEPEEHVSLLEETGYPNSGGQSEEAAEDGAWRADRVVTVSPPTDPNDNPDMGSQPEETAEGSWTDERLVERHLDDESSDTASEPTRSDRLWRRLWRVKQRSDPG